MNRPELFDNCGPLDYKSPRWGYLSPSVSTASRIFERLRSDIEWSLITLIPSVWLRRKVLCDSPKREKTSANPSGLRLFSLPVALPASKFSTQQASKQQLTMLSTVMTGQSAEQGICMLRPTDCNPQLREWPIATTSLLLATPVDWLAVENPCYTPRPVPAARARLGHFVQMQLGDARSVCPFRESWFLTACMVGGTLRNTSTAELRSCISRQVISGRSNQVPWCRKGMGPLPTPRTIEVHRLQCMGRCTASGELILTTHPMQISLLFPPSHPQPPHRGKIRVRQPQAKHRREDQK